MADSTASHRANRAWEVELPSSSQVRHSGPVHIVTLQRLMARTWPGLEQHRVGEWHVRAAGGFTSRANSALPLGDPDVDIEDAVDEVVRWYRARGLTPRLQLPGTLDGSPGPADEVAELCDRRGWAAEPWTLVLTRASRPAGDVRGLAFDWSSEPDGSWLDLYHYRGSELPATARRVITAAPATYLNALLDGRLVGIGRASLADQVVVLTAIEVVPAERRKGFGAAITEALAARGDEFGATSSALQVYQHNDVAVRLYRRLGFVDHHRYRYRYLAD